MKLRILGLIILATLPRVLYSATFTVVNTNASGAGSLQQAILDANANGGADTITFNIPGGPLTISPAGPLPNLIDSVTIDGSTQPGFSNHPIVEISGASAGLNANGFRIATSNCVVRALAIERFNGDGIQITNGMSSRVEGCYIGVAPDGFTRRGNGGAGVRMAGVAFGVRTTSANTIGGEAAAAHNLISANFYGVWMSETTDNVILGNIIGTDATGSLDIGNTNMGIFCYYGANQNVIGGTNSASRNLISGNGEDPYLYAGDGIRIDSSSSNSVYGNYIGVDATGTYAIPNSEHGVNIQFGYFNLIGGRASGQSNLISGNVVHGVNLGGFGKGRASLNYLGTPPPLPQGNIIQGNLIGSDVTGQLAIPNQRDGVFIAGMQGNLVGGYLAGERNVISGNLNHGVEIISYNTQSNQVAGNFIGTTLSGGLPLGNGEDGVNINASENMVGGTNVGAGNIIAFNANSGVVISYNLNNAILGNSIYANTNLGIDLQADYVTLNDPGDGDTGANNLQNYPVLTRALTNSTQTLLTGYLNSGTNITYRLEFFDNPTSDPSGYGQGRTYLGFTNLTTDASGNVNFMFTNPAALPLGHCLTATAADPDGNTSEFSQGRKVVSPNSLDLAVSVSDSSDPVAHFTNFTYTVTVTNFGPTNASGVFVTNRLSPGLTFVSSLPSQGTAGFSGGVVTWNVGALADGAGAVLAITVHGNVTAIESNSVSAIVSSLESDASNNSAVESTSIGIADLGMTLTDAPDPVVAGQTVTYTLTVTNLGPDDASGALVNVSFDAGLLITGASVSQGSFSQSGNDLQVHFNSINAHATATLTVTGIPTVVGTLSNGGNVSRNEFDPNSANDSDSQPTTVLAGPGILEFTSSFYTVSEGAGNAVIMVQRLGGAIDTVAASFATSNLTATAGSDYTAANGVLVFTNGETIKSFTVPITDDALAECNETLSLRLFSPTGGVILLPPTNAILEIFDNDLTSHGSVVAASRAVPNLITTADQTSYQPSISDDGRYVAFVSYADNLVLGADQNYYPDIYLNDRATGTNRLISANPSGQAANSYSSSPLISADGTRVAFSSSASDLSTNIINPGGNNIFVRALASGVSQLVSINTNGMGANGGGFLRSLSANGTRIAFESSASDLAPDDANGTVDCFVRDLGSYTCSLVSMNSAGTGSGNDYSDRPAISADGQFVAFGSYASDLVTIDSNHQYDIFRRNLSAGTTTLVSVNASGLAGGNNSCGSDLFISGDGRYISFESYATDLVPGSLNFALRVFRRDLVTGTTVMVSTNNSGAAVTSNCYLRGMSRDGRYVLFETTDGGLAANDANSSNDVFVRDMVAGTTMLVTVNQAATGSGNASSSSSVISPDGRYVSFASFATDLVAASKRSDVQDVFVRDLLTSTTTMGSIRFGSTNGSNQGVFTDFIISTNGVLAFSSAASDIARVDANGSADVFAYAPGSSGPALLSAAVGVTGGSYSQQNAINAAGTKLAFVSYAPNLVTNDNNSDQDVFLRDLPATTTLLVSVNAAGTGSATGFSENPSLSEDGRYVVYQSGAQDIAGNDTNGVTDVYLRDTVAGTNALVSVNQSGSGAGNDASINGRITPDGRFIVFESRAGNLVSNDVNAALSDIFIRSRTNNLTQLISLNAAGTGSGNSDSYNPRISPDGRYVVFETYATNLGPADSNNHFDVYARDRVNGSNILCSPNLAGNNGGSDDSYSALISDDGNTVVFYSLATNLVAGDTNSLGDLFAFNLGSHVMKLVSAAPSGVPGSGSSFNQSVSANGRYVAFQSDSTNLVANPDPNGSSADVFVRDLVAGTTALVSINCHGTGTGNDASYSPQISVDGRYVTFTSTASDLVPGIFLEHTPNIFRRDLQTGTTILLSQSRFNTGAANGSSFSSMASSNASVVSFVSDASDLVADDNNHSLDVFVWNAAVVASGVDLALSKTASTTTTGAYNNLTYTLAVTNIGSAPATGVSITDTLPTGMTFLSASTTQGVATNSGGTVTATVGGLNPGAGARVTISVTATIPGSITNTAVAAANESDSSPANNTSSAVVVVTPLARPPVSIVASNNNFYLSWPSTTPNVFLVERATNLNPVINWQPVTNAINDNGTIKWVFLTNNPALRESYYRLRKP
jgi:uncharacterized repeat protein (TIGR01451 family)